MANRPTDYTNRAALAVTVANSWQQLHHSYKVNFIEIADFKAKAILFQTKASANSNQDASKKENTAALKAVNYEIFKSIKRLKEYIRDSYSSNIDAMYAAYGLVLINKTYTFPRDNDSLKQQLGILVHKLQEENNPLAIRNQGLIYWQELTERQEREWLTSKTMKSQKSQLAQECKALHIEIGSYLSKLFRQLAIDYPREQIASVRRTFGFLNETYK